MHCIIVDLSDDDDMVRRGSTGTFINAQGNINALLLKDIFPESEKFILFRSFCTSLYKSIHANYG